MQRIGFGPRLAAAVIDTVIATVATWIVWAFFLMLGMPYLASVFFALTPLAYSSFEIFKAATPGKMIMTIIIRQADGSPAPQDMLIRRWVAKYSELLLYLLGAISTVSVVSYLGFIAGLVVIVGCFFVRKEERLTFHDMFAGTAVYNEG